MKKQVSSIKYQLLSIRNKLAHDTKYIIRDTSRGFTLIELLAVMVVMVAVGSIVVGIIVASLRGTNKTNNLNDVRANGNYAILQVSKTIEFAQGFGGMSLDGTTYDNSCVDKAGVQYKYVKLRAADNGTVIFSCLSNPATIASNGASLINTDTITLTSCYFTCAQGSVAESPTIGINITASQKTTSNFSEFKNTITFQTSVKIRNPNR